jgi:hypothetical protein
MHIKPKKRGLRARVLLAHAKSIHPTNKTTSAQNMSAQQESRRVLSAEEDAIWTTKSERIDMIVRRYRVQTRLGSIFSAGKRSIQSRSEDQWK